MTTKLAEGNLGKGKGNDICQTLLSFYSNNHTPEIILLKFLFITFFYHTYLRLLFHNSEGMNIIISLFIFYLLQLKLITFFIFKDFLIFLSLFFLISMASFQTSRWPPCSVILSLVTGPKCA